MKTTPWTLLAAALLLMPAMASASATSPSCVPTSKVLQTDWELAPDASFYQAHVLFKVKTCPATTGLEASAQAQGDFQVSCTVTVSKKVHEEGWSVNLIVFNIGSHTVTVDVFSHVECQGSVAVTVTHSGALGPRVASSSVTGVGFSTNGVQPDSSQVPSSTSGCSYFGVGSLSGSCPTNHAPDAGYSSTLAKAVPDSIEACVPGQWTNRLSGLPGVDDYSGSFNVCSGAIPLTTLDSTQLTNLVP